jgi:hypothetical protein
LDIQSVSHRAWEPDKATGRGFDSQTTYLEGCFLGNDRTECEDRRTTVVQQRTRSSDLQLLVGAVELEVLGRCIVPKVRRLQVVAGHCPIVPQLLRRHRPF